MITLYHANWDNNNKEISTVYSFLNIDKRDIYSDHKYLIYIQSLNIK